KVIVDAGMGTVGLDNSSLLVSTVNLEENSNRQPIPYKIPPGIMRQLDWGTSQNSVQLNEQSLSLEVRNLRDGYGRAAYKTTQVDFRSYGSFEMFVHLEQLGQELLNDNELNAFVRVGTDDRYNYYQYEKPLKVTHWGRALTEEEIWPEENQIKFPIAIFQ